jgi:hypothetical protein
MIILAQIFEFMLLMSGETCGKIEEVELNNGKFVFGEGREDVAEVPRSALWRMTDEALVGLSRRVIFRLGRHLSNDKK